MTIDVIVSGHPWKVALDPGEKAGTFTVTIKGNARLVNASWIDTDTVSLIDGGSAREIRLHSRDGAGAVGVEIGGKLYEAVVARPKLGATGATGATGVTGALAAKGAAGGFSHSVKAPMPGRVVRVLVAVGDHVNARQGVVVVEAMKMENELRTPRDGVVKEVSVVPGVTVETGTVLVVVADQ